MIRRLELAQAMLHRPAVLFLDEPTIGLDPVACLNGWDRLRALNKEQGMAILMTTHVMEEVDEICEVVAIFHHGRLAKSGSPAQLKDELCNRISRQEPGYRGQALSDVDRVASTRCKVDSWHVAVELASICGTVMF